MRWLFRNGKSDRVFILLDEFDAFIFSVYLHLSNRKQPFNLFRVAAEPVDDFILKLIFSSIVAIDLKRLYMSIFAYRLVYSFQEYTRLARYRFLSQTVRFSEYRLSALQSLP